LGKRGIATDGRLVRICALFKDRCDTTVALADWAAKFYADVAVSDEDRTVHLTAAIQPAIDTLVGKLESCGWTKPAIAAAIKETLAAHGIKMPQLAMPVRVLAMGTAHTPSVDAVLELLDREILLVRLKKR
jgi:glutamyl-tRNA synthetase